MYCERDKCSMNESACIARHGYHLKTQVQKRRLAPCLNDPGCVKCDQGDQTYKQYLEEENMTDKQIKIKKCAHCKQGKPADLEHYYKDTRSKDGFGSWCIECQKLSAGAAQKKKTPINKKVEKGGVVPGAKKIDPVLSFPGAAFPDVRKTLILNFSEHEDLFADIKAAAEEYFRTPEMQAMWWLTTRDKFKTGGE